MLLQNLPYAVPVFGALALFFAAYKAYWISIQPAGSARLQEIGGYIAEGAMAFLRRQYIILSLFVLIVAGLLGVANYFDPSPTTNWQVAISFVVGAFTSALAGYFGMKVATKANVRTAHAAEKGLNEALMVAFSGGNVMGMSVVGLGLLGLGSLFVIYGWEFGFLGIIDPNGDHAAFGQKAELVLNVLSGFSLGASSIALFARVGGGIFTKAADVGADLVGKVEANIPEDDPRNPAVIADNVGDNVGDVAGMGADLFESYVGAIIGAMVLALTFSMPTIESWVAAGAPRELHWESWQLQLSGMLLPMLIAGVGVICSIIGSAFVRTREGGNPQAALNGGSVAAAVATLVLSLPVVYLTFPPVFYIDGVVHYPWHLFITLAAGLVVGTAIGFLTEYYCSYDYRPTRSVAEASRQGAGPNIIRGTAVGMASTAWPLVLIAFAIIFSHQFGGLYGVALAGLGMLSTLGIQLSVDAYGPISDNAGGVAEMGGLGAHVRERTDKLDAVGNTTAAIGKGFAIGSAALTALALFAAFTQRINGELAKVGQLPISLDLGDTWVLSGVFLGSMLPFVFSAMSMSAVGSAAQDMIDEVRRQFREIPGLLEGKEGARADYAACVDIATQGAIRRMITPGVLAVLVPTIIGFLNVRMLAGVLVGCTTAGVCLAIYMANAGGAWDNAKKYIEKGGLEGFKKGSEPHKAAVTGDTVGDPFKDTSGPSLNILMKLMSVVAMVLAPLFV